MQYFGVTRGVIMIIQSWFGVGILPFEFYMLLIKLLSGVSRKLIREVCFFVK